MVTPRGLAATGRHGSTRSMSAPTEPRDTKLAICIPAFREDAGQLIRELSILPEAKDCTLLLYDDGSNDVDLERRHEAALAGFPGPTIHHVAAESRGRNPARNWLFAHAAADWILLIDAGRLPDSAHFLQRYLAAAEEAGEPALICGGVSVEQVTPAADQRLHHAEALALARADAETRRADPGRHVSASNILVHRSVLEAEPFDERFTRCGWEDVEWGLRVAGRFPVIHIDNTATLLGLESDGDLIAKLAGSGPNFARLIARHPGAGACLPLLTSARRVKGIPLLAPVSRRVAAAGFLPLRLRVAALDVFRSAACAPYIEPAD